MAIKFLERQQKYRRLGRIRMGDKQPNSSGRGDHPSKLREWRITSPSAELLAAAAESYGGDVRRWEGAPGDGDQYELYTQSESLDVAIPPILDGAPITAAFDQHMEFWTKGGCARRCDGEVNSLDGSACVCPVNDVDRMKEGRSLAAIKEGRGTCAITTRLNVLLYRVPDIGIFQLVTLGYYAATELGGAVSILHQANAAGRPQPARLRIEARTSVKDGKTSNYIVPVLELPTLSMGMALGIGDAIDVPSISAPRPVGIGPSRTVGALPAAPAPDPIALLLDKIGKLSDAKKTHAKAIAGEYRCKLTPKALAENAELLDTLTTWEEIGAPLPKPSTPAPIDVDSAPVDESPDMTAPFDEPVNA